MGDAGKAKPEMWLRSQGPAREGVALRKMIQGYLKDLNRRKQGDTAAVKALAQRMCQELTDTYS